MANKLFPCSLLLLTGLGLAQTDWQTLQPATRPTVRSGHALAFDTVRQKLVLFGGTTNVFTLGDQWEYDGNTWTQVNPIPKPPARAHAMMTYMPAIGRILLFGGLDSLNQPLRDTWLYDGTSWLQIPTQFSDPEPRFMGGMTFDPNSNTALLFGGQDQFRAFTGMWAFTGTAWFRPGRGSLEPPARSQCSLAYDVSRRRAVMFGGFNLASLLNDTWEWDGSIWRLMNPDVRPTPRAGHGAAYDPFRQRVVVNGGSTGAGGLSAQTFEYEGTAYFLQSASISARSQCPLAFDFNRARVVAFGGFSTTSGVLNDMNAYGATNPATFTPFGAGCTGSAGVPLLQAAPFSVPYLFTNFRTDVTKIPNNAPVSMIVGASNTTHNGVPLPLDLTPMGLPGCSLHASANVLVPLTTSGTAASLTLAIPFDLSLIGRSFYQQATVLDPTANAAGITVSNGGDARIGKLD